MWLPQGLDVRPEAEGHCFPVVFSPETRVKGLGVPEAMRFPTFPLTLPCTEVSSSHLGCVHLSPGWCPRLHLPGWGLGCPCLRGCQEESVRSGLGVAVECQDGGSSVVPTAGDRQGGPSFPCCCIQQDPSCPGLRRTAHSR